MNYWRSFKIVILTALSGGALFTLGKLWIHPNVPKPSPNLPESISLPQWKFYSSIDVSNPTDSDQDDFKPQHSRFISGKSYHFKPNQLHTKQQILALEIRYLAETDGDLRKILKQYKAIILVDAINKDSPILRRKDGIGSYIVFTEFERLHLSACINPSGNSSVTRDQFQSDRNKYDLQMGRIIGWLMGQAELREQSCLWVHLSSPLPKDSPIPTDKSVQNIETAWFDWYQQNSVVHQYKVL
jgi:cyanosortase A-associated protein